MMIAHYFSTQGWSLVGSFAGAAFEFVPFVAAASLRALRSKNPAILIIYGLLQQGYDRDWRLIFEFELRWTNFWRR
jgi:hypothetical protein